MRIKIIRSGSSNNATLIQTKDSNILIDIGVSKKVLEEELKEENLTIEDIHHLFITHTHSDHIKGLKPFLNATNANIWMSKSCFFELCFKEIIKEKHKDRIKPIKKENEEYLTIKLNNTKITPLELSHDKDETLGFLIEDGKKYTQITDTGYIKYETIELCKNSDAINLEANYDYDMLVNSNRADGLIERILSNKGHLENKDSMHYLNELIGRNTKYVIHSHISSECNTNKKIEKARKEMLNKKDVTFLFASKTKSIKIDI